MDNTMIFVKVDLLLYEQEFNALRKFIYYVEKSNLKDNDTIDFSPKYNCIDIIPFVPKGYKFLPEIVHIKKHSKIISGYMLLTIGTLKKFIT